jgi:hypothetical protein
MDHGYLPDGTQFRRWRPVSPLDQRWRAAMTEEATQLRDRWLARRAELIAAGTLDASIGRLIQGWHSQGFLPRAIQVQNRPAQAMLMELGFDASIAASLDPEEPDTDEFPSESARRQAADCLMAPIKEGRDLTPVDVVRVHGLLCPVIKPKAFPGIGDPSRLSRFKARGRFREHTALVLGSDRVLKEGCPPDQLSKEILAMAKATGDARRAGVLGAARAAWTLYALSIVHPFYDGNGRMARMLGSFVLVRDGGFPLLIPPALHTIYLDAFAKARLDQPEMLVRLVADCQNAVLWTALDVLK